jgi:hypothetical protein
MANGQIISKDLEQGYRESKFQDFGSNQGQNRYLKVDPR